jgi:Na+/melibiose symporter-like transporter
VIGLLIASAVLFAAFVWREMTTDQPLLHLSLFRDPTFSWSIVLGFVIVTAMFGAVFLLPVFLQSVHGYGALETGLLLVPQAATAAVLMPFGGRLTDRIGPRPVVVTGVIFLAISGLLLWRVDASTSIAFICAVMALRGVAMAFAMMPGMTAGLARIPRELTSRASSVTNTAQRVGMAVGIAVLVTFLSAQSSGAASSASCDPSPAAVSEAQQVFSSHPSTAAQLCDALRTRASQSSGFSSGGASSGPASTGRPELDAFLKGYSNGATSIAFDRTFLFLAIIAALGIIPAWFLRKPDPQPGAAMAEG